MIKRGCGDGLDELSIRKQTSLLGINRSTLYYKPLLSSDSLIANTIGEIYAESDCRYGYRKIGAALKELGLEVNNKKILRLMQEMNLQGLCPRKFPNTSAGDLRHKLYPYLLENLEITKANQVWATDLTYIKIENIFVYFIAIIDLYSRYIVAHDLLHSMEAITCVALLRQALKYRKPEIFNSDQGAQFTSTDFTGLLIENNIEISMDHKGRCFDNIFIERFWRTLKQEAIYYYRPASIAELEKIIGDFIPWYNNKRLHQSLGYRTPASVYLN